ncbi:Winged helix DNA-binding domain [Clostridium sp. ASBs410]|nr:Winged helix DNA-binding domain [Clostridium sp. ASBs410]
MELNRCAYVILGILRSKNAIDKVHGLTIAEISSLEKVSKPNTIHKRIKEMKETGFVDDGVKAGKAKTYYLTEAGLSILPEKMEEKNNV